MLGLEFGDEAVKQELPDNRHSDEGAVLKNELPRTPLKLDLARWVFDATIRPSPCIKTTGSPTTWSLFSCSSFPGHSCVTIASLYGLVYSAPTFAQSFDRERSPIRSVLHKDAIIYELDFREGMIHDSQRAIASPYMTIFKFRPVHHSTDFSPRSTPQAPQSAINPPIFYAVV